ncbi:MAG: hypothetical protein ACXVSE_08815 [Solirubrobacteraceae bacterium]
MKSTLAIYITLSAIAVVAIAQILYWKLVIKRHEVRAEDTCGAAWLPESLVTWPEIDMGAAESRFAAEPVLVGAA